MPTKRTSTFTTKNKSPYATSFITGCKNGTPASTVVNNISKKTNKPVSTIWNSLCKAGYCWSQKFNGTCVYWPTFNVKKNTTASNTTQTNMWQSFIDWCLVSGRCTPNQLNKYTSSQKNFMNYCRNFFGKQFTGSTKAVAKTNTGKNSSKKARKTTSSYKWTTKHTKKTNKTKTYNPTSWTRNYKFPTFKSRTTTTRRYVRAA